MTAGKLEVIIRHLSRIVLSISFRPCSYLFSSVFICGQIKRRCSRRFFRIGEVIENSYRVAAFGGSGTPITQIVISSS